MKRILYMVLALSAVAFLFMFLKDTAGYWHAFRTEDAPPTPTPSPTPVIRIADRAPLPSPITVGNMTLVSPQNNATVSLPFTVTGQARVFENQVVIAVKSSEGKDLYRGFDTAASPDVGQWGPFTHTVSYLATGEIPKEIILEVFWASPKDGEPTDVISVPLTFAGDAGSTRVVQSYFLSSVLDPEITCSKVFPVPRLISRTASAAAAAMELLLKGPTAAEAAQGYSSSIPGNIKMPRITIAQGNATADFGKDLEEGVAGACRVTAIRAQIERTLYQFPGVSGAFLMVEGNKDGILQP